MSRYSAATAPVCPKALPGCTGKIRERGATMCGNCARLYRRQPDNETFRPAESVEADRQKLKSTSDLALLRKKYDIALKTIETQQRQLDAANSLDSSIDTFVIEPQERSGISEATPVIVASDWHIEERVGSEVGSLNRFDLHIAHERAERFWRSSLRLVKLLNQDVAISTVVVALLGDFISNDIHGAENSEVNQLKPIEALIEVQDLIASGIEFLLANSTYTFTITCHSGNHARTTQTIRYSSENGHSLEYMMYIHLAAYFRQEPRVSFIIPDSPFSYLKVYDTTIRFHHGHLLKYGGGIGGLFIPAFKAISQYNKARHADLDVFGHFHQLKDGGNFLTNGSLIGWNGYAQAIRADFEPPRQLLFLMDKTRQRTCTWPILLTNK